MPPADFAAGDVGEQTVAARFSADEHFRRGVEDLELGRHAAALSHFEAAQRLDPTSALYRSYYGLCLCFTDGPLHEALRCVKMAAKLEGYRPDIQLNLGRVLLALDRRAQAYRAFQEGLAVQPNHPGIRRVLICLGIRRKRALPFLSRGHAVNVFLGRLRPAW